MTHDAAPPRRGHFRPRTRAGWIALLLFFALFVLAQPPIVTGPANRMEPWLLGFPFLYTYLLLVYLAQIAVLLWAWRRGL